MPNVDAVDQPGVDAERLRHVRDLDRRSREHAEAGELNSR